MEDREQNRFGLRLEEPVEELERPFASTLTDRIREAPNRPGHGFGDERTDIVGTDHGPLSAKERELVELHRGDPRLVPTFGVALLHETADALGQRLRRAWRQFEAAFARLRLDPAGECAGPRRFEL